MDGMLYILSNLFLINKMSSVNWLVEGQYNNV